MANGTLKVGTITTSSGSGNITIGSGVVVNVNRPSFSAEGTGLTVANSTWTELVGATENFDTDSAYSTSTGRFTVPTGQAGKYFFFATTRLKADNGTIDYLIFRFYKNGSTDLTPFQLNAATNQLKNSHIAGSALYDLSVGDYIEVYCQISGTSPIIGGGASDVTDRSFFGGYKIIGA